jgi:exonuclease SbcC
MIPEELHLRNFLSHQETDLELRGVHLASLVGENGAGKSSLLDAITWATWGRSRAPYGREENLIQHGETWVEVEYVFRMPYQGNVEHRFRILRRKETQSRRAAASLLDFQIQTEEGWRSLNGNSIRETQTRIVDELGLDYDTFANSAYLRQGHADEFTLQTSSERKRVLGTILGLERWEGYQELAKRRLALAQGQVQELERHLVDLKKELEQRPEVEASLEQAEALAQEAGARLQEVQEQVNELTRLQDQATALQAQIKELDAQAQQETQRLDALAQEAESHRLRRDTYQALIAQSQAIEERHKAYQAAVVEERSWSDKLSRTAKLQEEKTHWDQVIAQAGEALRDQIRTLDQESAALERTLAEARSRIEQQIGGLQGQIRQLEGRIPEVQLMQDLESAEARLADFDQTAALLDQSRSAAQQADVEQSRTAERNRQLRALMDKTKVNLEALADAEAVCPLCRQPLTPEHQVQLLEEIQAEGQTMGDEYRANQQRLQELKQDAVELAARVRGYEQALRERSAAEQQVARLRQQKEQGDEARAQIAVLQAESAGLQARLEGDDYGAGERARIARCQEERGGLQARLDGGEYAPEARQALEGLRAGLAELGYDLAAHNAIKAAIETLAVAETEYLELEKARVGVLGEEETLKRLAQDQTAQQQRLTQVREAAAAQQTALDTLRPRLDEASQIFQALQAVRQQEVEARQRVGAARQMLAALDTQQKRLTTMTKQQTELGTRVVLLKELRDAFGVNGIPAMIIEHTLPELEEEANRILQQLTGGRMHVRFDTQRET